MKATVPLVRRTTAALMLAALVAPSARAQAPDVPPAPPDTSIVAPPPPPPERYSAHTLIIFYDREQGNDSLLQAVNDYKADIIYQYRIINAIAIRLPDDTDIHEAIAHFRKVKGVLMVERDRVMQLHEIRPARVKKN